MERSEIGEIEWSIEGGECEASKGLVLNLGAHLSFALACVAFSVIVVAHCETLLSVSSELTTKSSTLLHEENFRDLAGEIHGNRQKK